MAKPKCLDYKHGFRINEVSMAKKAKRRGRPPGSKNKKSLGKSMATMDIAQLRAHIGDLQNTLAKKVSEQRAYFEDQLSQLGGYVSRKASAAAKAVTPGKGRTGKRAKAKPKYQSKKDKSVKWSGRGMTPVWMRDEMKGTKLKKEDFLIR
jgi:DNA-binding protein H-NS